MRLNSTTTQEEIRTVLDQAALQTWGPERRQALRAILDQAAQAIWTVLQVPLDPLSEEPDLAGPPQRPGEEG